MASFDWSESPVHTVEHLELLFDKFFSLATPHLFAALARHAGPEANLHAVRRLGRNGGHDGHDAAGALGSRFDTPTKQPPSSKTGGGGDVFTTAPVMKSAQARGKEPEQLLQQEGDVEMAGAEADKDDAEYQQQQQHRPSIELEELCRSIGELGKKAGVVESDEARYQRLARVQLTLQLMNLEVTEQAEALYKDLSESSDDGHDADGDGDGRDGGGDVVMEGTERLVV
ncbi:uncharacterized protein PG986_000213 [Apiospora aurea]|uniref:Uncharacterized protein n=1 Tax=Apiospora aurea TaxID=335848 RepID=A0ABR1QTD4_9PEZI